MHDRYYSVKSPILLTGAGFSKPFGGYLASEMWSIIFNQINSPELQALRTLLRKELNYERAYDLVMSGSESEYKFSLEEKIAFTKSLIEAYGELDQSICAHLQNNRAQIQCMRSFIERFSGQGRERGFIFTLNQDVLLERFASQDSGQFQIPALGHDAWFTGRLQERSDLIPEIDISSPHHLEQFRNHFWEKGTGLANFLYIKLHGSYRWKSSRNDNAMVIGYDKAGSIAKEPLLHWYLALFKETLNMGGQTLVVIGYGFMDKHINEVISGAAKKGLQLHVVNPMQPKDFKDHLLSLNRPAGGPAVPCGGEIWEMLSGYHCTSVDRMVPSNASALSGASFFRQVGLDH